MTRNVLFEITVEKLKASRSRYKSLLNEALKLVNYQIAKGRFNKLPFDSDGFGNFLMVNEIRPERFHSKQKARLISEKKAFVIKVSEKLDNFAQRLAVCHEFAHIILEDDLAARADLDRSGLQSFSKGMPAKVIEKLCDDCAKEMLLPKSCLKETIRGERPSLQLLNELAEEYSYPLDFIAERVLEVGYWHFRLLHWIIDDTKAVCLKSVPFVDDTSLVDVRIVNEIDSVVMRSHLSRGYQEGTEFIAFGNMADNYKLQAMPHQEGHVVSMIIFGQWRKHEFV